MQGLMITVAILAWGFAALVFGDARSAIHEIEALIGVLIGTVALAGAGIIGAITENHPFRVAIRKSAEAKLEREAAKAPRSA
jgi:hypothetical protein